MFELLYDPVAEIKRIKRQSFAKVLLYLLAVSLFEAAGVLFFAWRFVPDKLTASFVVNGLLAFIFGSMALHLIIAFFFSVAMHVLDGKGGYYEGLAAVVLSSVAPAVTTFFAGVIAFAPVGGIIAVLLVTFGYILGFATLFRAGKELFELDYAGVLVGFLVTVLPLVVATCVLARYIKFIL
ncbi:hypothetical protein HY489_03590 [Candidatus Woesearchaeota archaeon]|nr:hypothetical protein [Candidatus Woesearchaeota archaeon]